MKIMGVHWNADNVFLDNIFPCFRVLRYFCPEILFILGQEISLASGRAVELDYYRPVNVPGVAKNLWYFDSSVLEPFSLHIPVSFPVQHMLVPIIWQLELFHIVHADIFYK